jgi:hypothetical protein
MAPRAEVAIMRASAFRIVAEVAAAGASLAEER